MRSLVIVLASLLVTSCSSTLQLDAEKEAIRDVWDASIAAALKGDYRGWAEAFSEEVEIVHPSLNMRLLGKNAVEPVYRPIFDGASPYRSIETRRFSIQIAASGDLAWGTAATEMEVQGNRQVVWFALVFRKEAGNWKMVLGFDAPLGS